MLCVESKHVWMYEAVHAQRPARLVAVGVAAAVSAECRIVAGPLLIACFFQAPLRHPLALPPWSPPILHMLFHMDSSACPDSGWLWSYTRNQQHGMWGGGLDPTQEF